MKPVRTNRPMSEYEAALAWSVIAIGQTLVEAGTISETSLLAKLSENRRGAEEAGRTNEAAIYGMMIKFIGEPPTYYVPSNPNEPPSN